MYEPVQEMWFSQTIHTYIMSHIGLVGWLGFNVPPTAKSYGDETSVYSPIRRTGEARITGLGGYIYEPNAV